MRSAKLTAFLLSLAASLGVFAPALATNARLDAQTCQEMRGEQTKFIETGILVDIARGPDWAKTNLAPDKLKQIELFIMLDEQLKFGCRDAKFNLGPPPGEADARGAPGSAASEDGKPAAKANKPGAKKTDAKPADPNAKPVVKRKPKPKPTTEAADTKTNDAYVPQPSSGPAEASTSLGVAP